MRYDFITLDGTGSDNAGNNHTGNETYTEKSGKVNANSVYVRKGAGTSNGKITTLSTGAAVTIIGEEKDSSGAVWYKIRYSGGEGYMHSSYVTVTTGSASSGTQTSTPTPSYESKNGSVNGNYVAVRTGAGTSNTKKTSLNKDAAVTIIGEAKDSDGDVWYKIQYSGGEGYIFSKYVDIKTESSSSSSSSGSSSSNNSSNGNVPVDGVAGKEGVVNQPLVRVRSSAGTSSEVVDELVQDSEIFVESATKDSQGVVWYKISYAGVKGYMMGQYITLK